MAVGLFAGATTNTPSLAAAQQALKDVPQVAHDSHTLALPGMAYAVAYPFGIIGIILTMVLIKWVFRINPQREAEALDALHARERAAALGTMTLKVTNPNLDGVALIRGFRFPGARASSFRASAAAPPPASLAATRSSTPVICSSPSDRTMSSSNSG